jgi:hypothetical protein
VVTALAVSWNPLMNSNPKAIASANRRKSKLIKGKLEAEVNNSMGISFSNSRKNFADAKVT